MKRIIALITVSFIFLIPHIPVYAGFFSLDSG